MITFDDAKNDVINSHLPLDSSAWNYVGYSQYHHLLFVGVQMHDDFAIFSQPALLYMQDNRLRLVHTQHFHSIGCS